MNCHPYQFNTAQAGVHPDLVSTVLRYRGKPYLRPIPEHQHQAFSNILCFLKNRTAPIIIDSCCGTGYSSKFLATIFPNHTVIGIDKSHHRLTRGRKESSPANCLIVRAEVVDLWRLFAEQNLPIERHYLLFPNPWPKVGHLKRRFYAHPICNTMVTLAPYFEMRTNWYIYAQECALALKVLGKDASIHNKVDKTYMTLFEKKYVETESPIYIVKSAN